MELRVLMLLASVTTIAEGKRDGWEYCGGSCLWGYTAKESSTDNQTSTLVHELISFFQLLNLKVVITFEAEVFLQKYHISMCEGYVVWHEWLLISALTIERQFGNIHLQSTGCCMKISGHKIPLHKNMFIYFFLFSNCSFFSCGIMYSFILSGLNCSQP